MSTLNNNFNTESHSKLNMNYYQLLGVDKKADPDEIKHAYREKLKD